MYVPMYMYVCILPVYECNNDVHVRVVGKTRVPKTATIKTARTKPRRSKRRKAQNVAVHIRTFHNRAGHITEICSSSTRVASLSINTSVMLDNKWMLKHEKNVAEMNGSVIDENNDAEVEVEAELLERIILR